MDLLKLFKNETGKNTVLTASYVVPDSARCAGSIYIYNCPLGVDVRCLVWFGVPMPNNQRLTSDGCVACCSYGVLSFAITNIFSKKAL